MLVLALEFSRDITARAAHADSPVKGRHRISGTHGTSGRSPAQGRAGGIVEKLSLAAVPSKRKRESPASPAGAGSSPDGLAFPKEHEAVRRPPAYRRCRVTSVQLGSGRS